MTSSRMPAIPLDHLTEAQREVYDRIASGPRGEIGAPHWAWLRSPALAEKAQDYGRFCRFETSVDPRLIEIAILTTAAHWQAALEWDLHVKEALGMGLAAATIEEIRRQGDPHFELEAEHAVYLFTRELLEKRQAQAGTYALLLEAIDETGTVELVGILGYYALISMTIVTFEVPSHICAEDSFSDLRMKE